MSIRLMQACYGINLPPNRLLVLLVFADHANDEGENCYPSCECIMASTNIARSTVKLINREFRSKGVLVLVSRGSGGTDGNGRGLPTIYRLDVERAREVYSVTKAWCEYEAKREERRAATKGPAARPLAQESKVSARSDGSSSPDPLPSKSKGPEPEGKGPDPGGKGPAALDPNHYKNQYKNLKRGRAREGGPHRRPPSARASGPTRPRVQDRFRAEVIPALDPRLASATDIRSWITSLDVVADDGSVLVLRAATKCRANRVETQFKRALEIAAGCRIEILTDPWPVLEEKYAESILATKVRLGIHNEDEGAELTASTSKSGRQDRSRGIKPAQHCEGNL